MHLGVRAFHQRIVWRQKLLSFAMFSTSRLRKKLIHYRFEVPQKRIVPFTNWSHAWRMVYLELEDD